MSHCDHFREAIAAAGLTAPDTIIDDGKLHRFSSNGKPRDESGWYKLHGDDRPAGAFGCWRAQIQETWKSTGPRKEYSAAEKLAWKTRMQQVEREREDILNREREACALLAAEWMLKSVPVTDHAYLTAKEIPGPGARVLNGELLIPVKLDNTLVVGLQRILPDGQKLFLRGTPMALGGYHVIGKPTRSGPIAIVEGYATGVTVHLATGYCTVVAFNAGNLIKVAQKIRKALPHAVIILGADDDAFTVRPSGESWNPGVDAAMAAAASIGANIATPVWNSERGLGTDFNDLFILEGLDAVAACFANAKPPEIRDAAPVKQPVKPVSDGSPSAANNAGSSAGGFPPFTSGAAVTESPDQPQTGSGSAVRTELLTLEGMESTVSRHMVAQAYGLDANEKGIPHSSVANITRVLLSDVSLGRMIWFDEFLDRIMTIWRSAEPREWADVDDINLQIYLQEALGMPKLGKQTVSDAVAVVANMDRRNEARAYIEGLTWDGVERLPTFMPDCFGTADNDYTRGAGRNFWISMVARVMRPGCKVDTMIVLEGVQGAGKSRALAIIGGQWFAEANQSPTDKDFYLNLAGKMIIEIGEMDAFNRSEVTKVKQVITCQTDRYRAPYERRAADHPRRCVFAGTTNRDDWNKDETGARRFWPVYCTVARHDVLMANRDQYFAEAAHMLANGADWWTMPEEDTKRQQEARRESDELEGVLTDWLSARDEVSVREVMDDMMKVPLERQDKAMQMRIGKALRAIGWQRPEAATFRGGKLVRLWVRREGMKDEAF